MVEGFMAAVFKSVIEATVITFKIVRFIFRGIGGLMKKSDDNINSQSYNSSSHEQDKRQ